MTVRGRSAGPVWRSELSAQRSRRTWASGICSCCLRAKPTKHWPADRLMRIQGLLWIWPREMQDDLSWDDAAELGGQTATPAGERHEVHHGEAILLPAARECKGENRHIQQICFGAPGIAPETFDFRAESRHRFVLPVHPTARQNAQLQLLRNINMMSWDGEPCQTLNRPPPMRS